MLSLSEECPLEIAVAYLIASAVIGKSYGKIKLIGMV